jgi:hypothetical protein
MSSEVTRSSTLRPLADLIEAIANDWPTDTTESAITKAVAESKLLQVVGATISRELDQIESEDRKRAHDALREVAIELAIDERMRSSNDREAQVNDVEIIRVLLQPAPPALILRRVAEALETDLPDVVQKAARILDQRD